MASIEKETLTSTSGNGQLDLKETSFLKKEKDQVEVEIARIEKGSKEIVLTFDRDEFEKKYSPIVDSLFGKNIVYEYVNVVDDDIWGKNGDPALQLSFFDVEKGYSYNVFCFDIEKKTKDGGVSYSLKAAPGSHKWTFVSCKGTNCKSGCEKEGRQCTLCVPADESLPHSCVRDEKSVWEVALTPAASLIIAIIGIFF